MDLWKLREGKSGQFTTFDPGSKNKVIEVKPGKTETFIDAEGPGIITRMWFTFSGWFWEHWNPGNVPDPAILKKLILRIYWDGSETPSVEAPMGDFFGIGHMEYRPFCSQFLGMSSGGFYCYFPMPFRKVRLTIENLHESLPSSVFMNVNYNRLDSLPEDAGRFHCQFYTGYNAGAEPLTVLQVKGRGQYAGLCLSMQGKNPNYLSFLEAPEYFYIDGEKEPRLVGTGLEDYYNGGWYFRDGEFSAPFHGVPLKDALRSMISMYRFHDQDAVLFSSALRMAFISPWASERLQPFWYASTAYYYLDRPGSLEKTGDFRKLPAPYRRRDADHQSIP